MKADTRSYPRKVLRCLALVALPGATPLRGKTLDVSLDGVSIMLADQLTVGQVCSVGFEAPLNGRMVRITSPARAVYSILHGTDGFRTGFQFERMDAANSKLLAELMI